MTDKSKSKYKPPLVCRNADGSLSVDGAPLTVENIGESALTHYYTLKSVVIYGNQHDTVVLYVRDKHGLERLTPPPHSRKPVLIPMRVSIGTAISYVRNRIMPTFGEPFENLFTEEYQNLEGRL